MTRMILFVIAILLFSVPVAASAQEADTPLPAVQPDTRIVLAIAEPAQRHLVRPVAAEPVRAVVFATPEEMAYQIGNEADSAGAKVIRADGPPRNLRPEDQ